MLDYISIKFKPYKVGLILLVGIFVLAAILPSGINGVFTFTLILFLVFSFLTKMEDSSSFLKNGLFIYIPFVLVSGLLAFVDMNAIFLFIPAAAIISTYAGLFIRSQWSRSSLSMNIFIVLAYCIVITVISVTVFPRVTENNLTHHKNKPCPEFKLQMLDGELVSSYDLLGKVVIMDFWTTWCGPCRDQFPDLVKIYERNKDNSEVFFIAVNTSWREESIEGIKSFIIEHSLNFPVAYDSAAIVTNLMKVKSVPQTILIDKEGRIRIKHTGSYGRNRYFLKNMNKHIEELLNED